MKTSDIVSDQEVVRAFSGVNFGSLSPREVVDEGVKKCAVGFHCGSTQIAILKELGLLKNIKGRDADLSAKGKEYARALYLDGWC